MPSVRDDNEKIVPGDIRDLSYLPWSPQAYLGSAGWKFVQAERWVDGNKNLSREDGKIWAEGTILKWRPEQKDEYLKINIPSEKNHEKTKIGLTLAHRPDGGSISFLLNGKPVKFDNLQNLSLYMPLRTVLDNHFSEQVTLKKGANELIIEMPGADGSKSVYIDFVWIKE